MSTVEIYKPKNPVRFVTASSLFDGHDASINIMRRILQASGAEVIHLGHNRSVEEVVNAAVQEDVQGIAISSYQGGHVEYFKYMYDLLKEKGASHIRIYGGGGGVIIPREIKELHEYGIAWIFSPDDGRKFGLQGMINIMLKECDYPTITSQLTDEINQLKAGNIRSVAKFITLAENQIGAKQEVASSVETAFDEIKLLAKKAPVVGITGTGGAGKSSLTDELIRRFLNEIPDKKVAILSIDPTKQKTGGALLGDRIRMNAIFHSRVYMRSLATRGSRTELSLAIRDAINVVKAAGYDLIIVETSGIGQGDAEIAEISDIAMYVMTSEFGAPSQLEKIDMIDFADLIVINKFERKGSEDAKSQVQKQYQRSHLLFDKDLKSMPVYGTIASQFNDPGTNALFAALVEKINEKMSKNWEVPFSKDALVEKQNVIIPNSRRYYLREISETVRNYHKKAEEQVRLARRLFQLEGALQAVREKETNDDVISSLEALKNDVYESLTKESKSIINNWGKLKEKYSGKQFVTKIRDKEIITELTTKSLSGLDIPKVSLPKYEDYGEILKWVYKENVPGSFPYTAGVFPFKREGEDPKRQFAGEGTPERTNKRFHYLSENDPAKRLSTAFDSVTLYGEDPDYRPDIYGKVGESGVSICTLDDMKKLYAGFDLCHPSTSVSMTINGPAPIILAMYMNTAIDQQVQFKEKELGRSLTLEEYTTVKESTLQVVRGTVQADILKEDQGQNTCIFSTEFALRMMGDIQQYFIDHKVRNYYSVSISGYHIAEAGANPISQLAFTLANGFTYVEYYLSRGMDINDFAPNLSFFFSNGLDPEYSVIGRVARRIWATVMRDKYGANERSQKLKYHIQTSGRSLHAQEIDFNDIRTTLQALMALHDNCNSLHTNAYDEAITTPTEESVRRAMAIQMIITKEHGLTKNENPLQGSFIIEELTDLVEEAVLAEFDRLNDRGGVLGAMETQYQRGKIQEESMYYEMKKHSGELPIIGVNTYLNPNPPTEEEMNSIELARATKEEKETQIRNLNQFKEKNSDKVEQAIKQLKNTAMNGGNIFAELMETVKVASLGQITKALYDVGGQYRRNM
ncbi:methylmalonyl-CoA mutase [Heyndrickxia sporothermodurans]|uniref:Fused isobutyryl-CoA mutase n=1 Tax=Heyndrickxia sporothermodurans TaxID=46224 RepID=A0AB37HI05_9BACI|nr:fused isobutyryl-CoA mutase/GTPase IcmF [Heyndrickxia sporothermodurans]MBL5767537.1 methylmalonyl-CoA mutase family protein [Heyndrickxia sporothermodurans]MBL5771064.1 methylmalonyl-CoA mutase family protein [Heyndrickxia sporothermodurans]MBL5774733.1 methylmalonyl-CoA mutase family protein [Heyndrickxia sporothermodurans]MBL5778145.1 methylmalonyl-CoA mutase family protein [Heyndrickxia sporothermodurans]MBL5780295.1 methylmalonyl-CoA mutase family protein [Heyndrickxia sporothermoduran